MWRLGSRCLFLLVLLTCGTVCGAARTPVGEILSLEGSVEFSTNKTVWHPAKTNQLLYAFDYLRTLKNSRAMLRLADLGRVRINEQTTLTILPASGRADETKVNIMMGAAYLLLLLEVEWVVFGSF